MSDKDERIDGDATVPKAKRTGRHGTDPQSQPAEFTDEMRVNRFTPPPEPESEDDEKE